MLKGNASPESENSAPQTLFDAIRSHAAARPQAPAIVFPNRATLTYEALQQQIERVRQVLKRAGIGARNRVAIIMPDGPELAIAIAAVACHATIVPLNPKLTAAEIDDLLVSLRLGVVILPEGADIPAREVALRHGASLLEVAAREGGIEFTLCTPPLPSATPNVVAGPDDVAMILRTSGTIARPKLVAVTHRNLVAMALRLQNWFALTPSDCVLCVMPLHYAQGLKNALFVPLILGSSLACPSRSSGADVFAWLAELRPTWYSAGPTLHRAMLDRARSLDRTGGFRHSLRFIHSAAAALPDAVHDGLEEIFGVPVLDSYGLSEAGLVAANATTQVARRRGTVGKPWRDEVAIRGEDGSVVAMGGPGEIVVRGPGLSPGYIDDPDANRSAFVDGWLRTGDLGRIDSDGFLIVVGRIKELINRGGEKIAPAEIDVALLRHPAVAEAAAFPVFHPRLGEDVAAAVVVRPGATVTALQLRRYLRASIASFKIPRCIYLVASLPKGDTGKIRRSELSLIVGAGSMEHSAPVWRSALEIEIAKIWQRLLERDNIGPDDEFFEIGGDSLLATQMLLELERLTGGVLPETLLFETATIRQLAENLVHKPDKADRNLLVQLQPGTGKPPFIFIDGDFWGGGYYARNIARLLGPEYPFYALRSHGLQGDDIPSIEQMAQDYIRRINAAKLPGPYRLGGHCNGALIAWELAHQLEAAGERVELVALIEPISLNARSGIRFIARALDWVIACFVNDAERREARKTLAMLLLWQTIRRAAERRKAWVSFARSLRPRAARRMNRLLHERGRKAEKTDDSLHGFARSISEKNQELAERLTHLLQGYQRTMARYIPAPVAANLLCFVAQSHSRNFEYAGDPWQSLAPHVEIAITPGDHLTCITTYAEPLINRLRDYVVALGGIT